MNDKQRLHKTIQLFVPVSLMVLSLSIASITIGVQYHNHPCQEARKSGLILSEWLLGQGVFKMIVVVVMSGFLGFIYRKSRTLDAFGVFDCVCTQRALFAILITMLLDIVFTIIWLIIGIMVISTEENTTCIDRNIHLAVLSLINIILMGVFSACYPYVFFHLTVSSESDSSRLVNRTVI